MSLWRTQFLNGNDLGGVQRTRRRILRPRGQRGDGGLYGGRIWLVGTGGFGVPVEGAEGRERASATTFVAPGVWGKSAVNSAR